MSIPTEMAFTDAFWTAVDKFELCRSEVITKVLELKANPFLGKALNGLEAVRAWDVQIEGKGHFRWFYIVEDELSLVLNVFIVPNPDPASNVAEDVMLVARLVEIAFRLFGS